MSSRDDRILNIIGQLAIATDGAVAGVALAYLCIKTWWRFARTSSALREIREAKYVPNISDLPSLLSQSDSDEKQQLVIVRGLVAAAAAAAIDEKSSSSSSSAPAGSYINCGDKAVVLQKTQTCIYSDSKGGLLGWAAADLGSILLGNNNNRSSWRNQTKSTSITTIPFLLVGGDDNNNNNNNNNVCVEVNLDGSAHSIPLVTVYHHLQPVPTTTYSFLQALFGHSYPVGLLDEEKILPLGKEISALGICTPRQPAGGGGGHFQIKSCHHLPFFLSEMTKDQMLVDLHHKTRILFWCGILFGSLSVGALGYAVSKNWRRWKDWRERRLQSRINEAAQVHTDDVPVDDEAGDIPDGQLCVICLMRRKRSAFVPCGHFVCCHRCALSVERDSAPKCPLCRQLIRTSVRIYDS